MSDLQEAITTIKVMDSKVTNIDKTVNAISKSLNDNETGLIPSQARNKEAIRGLKWFRGVSATVLLAVSGWVVYLSITFGQKLQAIQGI